MLRIVVTVLFLLVASVGSAAEAQSLKGSTASMIRQNQVAQENKFTFLETPADVRRFVEAGYLVPVPGNADYRLHNVPFPYARPAVKTFIERLARQYRAACGEVLVVTSLTRPTSRQPPNSHALSVHPTGMAVDLRISRRASCRRWLESTLLHLEGQGVIDATRERRPPHYHVAVFPERYTTYVALQQGGAGGTEDEGGAVAWRAAEEKASGEGYIIHRVRAGETLSHIARRYGTTVARLKETNNLTSSRILAGQRLKVPVSGSRESASGD